MNLRNFVKSSHIYLKSQFTLDRRSHHNSFLRTLDYGKDINIRTNLLKVNGYINGEKEELTLVPFYPRGNRNPKSQCMVVWIKEE